MKHCNVLSGLVSLMGMAAALGGCTKALQSTPNAEGDKGVFQLAGHDDTSLTAYVIDPPDEITIKAPSIKEIDNSKQVVRPDGTISLNLLGVVKVSGLTPAQAQQELSKLAAKYYTNPDVKVEVTANSKFFTIFGRGANNQKKIPYTGNDNVVKALAEAGLSEHAWPQQVWLVRPERNGQPAARAVVDFKNIQENGSFKQNYVIHEGDIITLPDSPLASFNFKMTEVLGPVSGATEVGSSAQSVVPGR
jgi:protein involved in polysaccharide export with SLBB domain